MGTVQNHGGGRPVVPEMFEDEEASASSMALDAPLGDVIDGRSGERRRGKHGDRSRATSFSMSLSSLSAAAVSEPKPTDEGMAELGVEAHNSTSAGVALGH